MQRCGGDWLCNAWYDLGESFHMYVYIAVAVIVIFCVTAVQYRSSYGFSRVQCESIVRAARASRHDHYGYSAHEQRVGVAHDDTTEDVAEAGMLPSQCLPARLKPCFARARMHWE